jgi:hydrogenase maturation protease
MHQPLLVLGIGNVLMGDDGVGVHAVRALAAARDDGTGLPPGCDVVDGGTSGLSLLPLVTRASSLIVVDALDVGSRPGTVHTLTGSALYGKGRSLSVHEVGAGDLLAAARLTGGLPEDVVLVGVQVARVAPGCELSPPVRDALPEVMRMVTARSSCGQVSPVRN